MKNKNNILLTAGIRKSRLSMAQSSDALDKIKKIFHSLNFKIKTISTCGDKNREMDLRIAPPDFFTKELDDAILANKINCAIHSAKDLPDKINEKLDWVWLAWHEDPRDVIILPKSNAQIPTPASRLKIGISSVRRENFCKKRFPDAQLLPIRGNVDERIAQLDDGKFDILIMAAAGLKRLGMENRISEYIPPTELPPPEGQGYLALTFRTDNLIFCEIRKLFIKTVIFAGAGTGNPEHITMETLSALKNCDICIYDALLSPELIKMLPSSATAIFAGKRSGKHSMKQDEINLLIAKFARQGKKVLRLKGGDPTIFGRLAEEIETLDKLAIPYRIIPGISSLNAVGATGLMLTRRGISRGFSVMTSKRSGSNDFFHPSKKERLAFPSLYFMGLSDIANIAKSLITEGSSVDTNASVIISAGIEAEEKIISATLREFVKSSVQIPVNEAPGIFIVGKNATPSYLLKKHGALKGKKILLTCSEALIQKSSQKIKELGGIPVNMPMLNLMPSLEFLKKNQDFRSYDLIILTSPSAVKIFMEALIQNGNDIRSLPAIAVCGPGSEEELRKYGINADIAADDEFGASGILKALRNKIGKKSKILRLRSNKAGEELSCELRKSGAAVTDEILYKNIPINYQKLPEFDAVFFASSSAVESFYKNFPEENLKNKLVSPIGQPTLTTLKKLKFKGKIILPKEASVSDAIDALAIHLIEEELKKLR